MIKSINHQNNILFQSSKTVKQETTKQEKKSSNNHKALALTLIGLCTLGMYIVYSKSKKAIPVAPEDLQGEELEEYISAKFNAKPHKVNYDRYKKGFISYLDQVRKNKALENIK